MCDGRYDGEPWNDEEEYDPRLLWLMRCDVDMPFVDWVQAIQADGTAESSYIFYTDRIAPLYTLPDDKKAAMLDAIIEEMLLHKHRPLSPDLEAIIVPMALQMRKDRLKYQRKCEQNLRRKHEREAQA